MVVPQRKPRHTFDPQVTLDTILAQIRRMDDNQLTRLSLHPAGLSCDSTLPLSSAVNVMAALPAIWQRAEETRFPESLSDMERIDLAQTWGIGALCEDGSYSLSLPRSLWHQTASIQRQLLQVLSEMTQGEQSVREIRERTEDIKMAIAGGETRSETQRQQDKPLDGAEQPRKRQEASPPGPQLAADGIEPDQELEVGREQQSPLRVGGVVSLPPFHDNIESPQRTDQDHGLEILSDSQDASAYLQTPQKSLPRRVITSVRRSFSSLRRSLTRSNRRVSHGGSERGRPSSIMPDFSDDLNTSPTSLISNRSIGSQHDRVFIASPTRRGHAEPEEESINRLAHGNPASTNSESSYSPGPSRQLLRILYSERLPELRKKSRLPTVSCDRCSARHGKNSNDSCDYSLLKPRSACTSCRLSKHKCPVSCIDMIHQARSTAAVLALEIMHRLLLHREETTGVRDVDGRLAYRALDHYRRINHWFAVHEDDLEDALPDMNFQRDERRKTSMVGRRRSRSTLGHVEEKKRCAGQMLCNLLHNLTVSIPALALAYEKVVATV